MKSFKTTKLIKTDEIIRVYLKGFGYTKLTVIANTEFFLSTHSSKEFYDQLNKGDILEAYLWRESLASYEFKTKVLGKFYAEMPLIFTSHTEKISSSKERKCLMAQVSLPFRFYSLPVENSEKKFSSHEIVFQNGIISKLSDREMSFTYAGQQLPEKSLIRGHFPINKQELEITGKIISEKKQKSSYIYLIEFIGTSNKDRNTILDFVFNVYRE